MKILKALMASPFFVFMLAVIERSLAFYILERLQQRDLITLAENQ